MSEKQVSTGRWIARNLIGAAVFFTVLVVLATVLLGIFTRHGKVIEVPDMTNISVAEARQIASDAGVRIEVVDSVFVRRMAKGAVYRQSPKAGASVKSGRRVMLTINAVNAKKVSMPNLVGYSMRQAKAELSSKGLNLGKLIYVEDIATNYVLKQQYRGRDISQGSEVESGSNIDLVVGLNPSDNVTIIPNVVGLKYVRAVDAIHDNSLNISKLVFDSSVKNYTDSLNAVVTRQNPASSQYPITMGSDVTLYLSVEGL